MTDLIGQYSINYTGDANFFGFYGYYENNNYNEMVKDTDFKATVDTIGKDKIVNSSIASLKNRRCNTDRSSISCLGNIRTGKK